MISHVEFTPDGLFVYRYVKEKLVKRRPKKLTIATYLRCRCEIAEGTTLKQIFAAVDRYKFLKLIMSQYSWCPSLEEFHSQIKEPIIEEDETPLTRLEIYHHAEATSKIEKKKHPGGTRERRITVDFDYYDGFHGIGPAEPNYQGPMREDNTVNYSVSCTPMWQLADIPVKLVKEFTVYTPLRERVNGAPCEKELVTSRDFTMLEVLDAIYDDISFYGGPQESAEFIEKMKQRMDSIDLESTPLIPMEQMAKQLNLDLPESKLDDKKILFHPDVAKFFGVDPNTIPLDDKEIMGNDEKPL